VPLASVICLLPPEGVRQKSLRPLQKAQKLVCTIDRTGVQWKWRDRPEDCGPEEESGGSRGVGWGVRLEWVGWKKGPGLETGSFLCPGRDPGAPKGAKWLLRRMAQGQMGGLGTGNEEAEDSTIRE